MYFFFLFSFYGGLRPFLLLAASASVVAASAAAASVAGDADAAIAAVAAADAAVQYLQGAGIRTRDFATTDRCATSELYTHP